MEDKRRVRRQTSDAQSIVSWCGSASGEAFCSLRGRRPSCKPGERTAQTRPVDKLAKNLKHYHATSGAASCSLQPDNVGSKQCNDVERAKRGPSFNSCFHHYRFVVAFLAGTASGFMMIHRYSMTIAVLQMVNQTHLYLTEHPNKTLQDFLDEGFVPGGGEFDWNNEIVAIILGWYMFSYTLPQLLMARWNVLIGCRLAVPISLTICSISSLLIPTAAYMGWKWVVACRLLNGFGGAGVLPAMLTLLEDWLRYDELSSGLSIGTLLFALFVAFTPLFSGYLAAIHWSYAFYVPSYATLAFCALWLVLITNKPQSNWLTSERELDHLCDCNTCQDSKSSNNGGGTSGQAEEGQATDDSDDYKADSWLQILKVPSFYAYLIVWSLYCSGVTGFTFVMPTYMRQFLKIPISANGFYCAIVQVGYLVACAWPQQLLRLMLKMNLSMTRARIIIQGLAASMMALAFLYVGTFHQNQLVMFFTNRAFMVADIIVTGSIMSNFAKAGLSSVAYAMINTVGNLSLCGVSPLIGWWLDRTGSSNWGWQVAFYGLGGAQLAMFLLFWLFIDSKPIRFKNKSTKSPEMVSEQRRGSK